MLAAVTAVAALARSLDEVDKSCDCAEFGVEGGGPSVAQVTMLVVKVMAFAATGGRNTKKRYVRVQGKKKEQECLTDEGPNTCKRPQDEVVYSQRPRTKYHVKPIPHLILYQARCRRFGVIRLRGGGTYGRA